MTAHNKEQNENRPIFQYTLDDEPQSTSEHVLTARKILTNGGLNPELYYLVQIIGHEQNSYRDHPDEEIRMHEHMQFISVFIGATPVSEPMWD